MDLSFATRKLRTICEDEAAAKRVLGAKCARWLRDRLADVDAAKTVNELVVGNPAPLGVDKFQLNLGKDLRLVFGSAHTDATATRQSRAGVDWSRVSRIKLLEIEKAK